MHNFHPNRELAWVVVTAESFVKFGEENLFSDKYTFFLIEHMKKNKVRERLAIFPESTKKTRYSHFRNRQENLGILLDDQ